MPVLGQVSVSAQCRSDFCSLFTQKFGANAIGSYWGVPAKYRPGVELATSKKPRSEGDFVACLADRVWGNVSQDRFRNNRFAFFELSNQNANSCIELLSLDLSIQTMQTNYFESCHKIGKSMSSSNITTD